MDFYGTFWSLVPALAAIALALITKEVYFSLFVGIMLGGLLYSGFSIGAAVTHIFDSGFIDTLSVDTNISILIFLVILGIMVCLMNRAGGSRAFGIWASTHIKSRVGVQLTTIILGCFIFIDDYFNCLTVGSVMRPVTDKHRISRAKLSYLIDSTAAPICIIAPISSWAAAVASYVEGDNGMELFVRAIPYNFYALFTILMMIILVVRKQDYGLMKRHEENALQGDVYTTQDRPYDDVSSDEVNQNGKVIDLIIPIISLMICCIIGMTYSASFGLAIGSFFSLIITIVLYLIRRAITFSDCMNCIPDGFKSMVPAILILIFAWTLKEMTDSLGVSAFVEHTVQELTGGFLHLLPAIIFVLGSLIAFATGTSWGTFGILIPIVIAVFGVENQELTVIAVSACMAGAVCGDHCSPISDTTIMASAGAQCNHVNHVSTQLPYAITVAAVSFITYIVAGFVQSAWIALPIGAALLVVVLLVLGKMKEAEA